MMLETLLAHAFQALGIVPEYVSIAPTSNGTGYDVIVTWDGLTTRGWFGNGTLEIPDAHWTRCAESLMTQRTQH